MGSLIFTSEQKEFTSGGDNFFEVNFTPFSIGYYYYVIEANGESFPGKIVYIR